MAVKIGQIKPGAVFRFKTAARRVTSLSKPLGAGFDVNWEYADGKKRGGRLTGSQWVHYFKADAIEQIPDPVAAGGVRRLRSGREVPSLMDTVNITITTHCPAKWAIVDLETGELWGHDGTQFKRLTASEAAEVSAASNLAANDQRNLAHVYGGACPDDVTGPDSRDPNCPACQLMDLTHNGTKFHHLTSSEASEVSDALNLGSGLEAKP